MDVASWLSRHRTHRLACVSAAAHRGLALLRSPDVPHLAVPKHNGARLPDGWRIHRSAPLERVPPSAPTESLPDMLAHVAQCLDPEEARIVWESALRRQLVSLAQLRRVAWREPAARLLARTVSDQSDSLLETLVLHRLRDCGVGVEQQVRLLGHRVDFVLDRRLVLQVDGFAFHADRGQRREDIEHDARLLLEGWPVIRIGYEQVMGDWAVTLARLLRALALAAA